MKLIKRLILSAVLLGSSMGSMKASFAQDSMGSSNSDLALTFLGGAGLASASCYVESPLAKWALRVCAVAPLFAHLVPKKTIKLLNNVPVIGTYLKLSSKILPCQDGCEGICKQCKVKRLYQFYPLILAPVGLAALLTKPKLTSPSPNPQQTPEPNPQPIPEPNLTNDSDDSSEENENECILCCAADHDMQTPCCNADICRACWNRTIQGENEQVRRYTVENGNIVNTQEQPMIDIFGNPLFTEDGQWLVGDRNGNHRINLQNDITNIRLVFNAINTHNQRIQANEITDQNGEQLYVWDLNGAPLRMVQNGQGNWEITRIEEQGQLVPLHVANPVPTFAPEFIDDSVHHGGQCPFCQQEPK